MNAREYHNGMTRVFQSANTNAEENIKRHLDRLEDKEVEETQETEEVEQPEKDQVVRTNEEED